MRHILNGWLEEVNLIITENYIALNGKCYTYVISTIILQLDWKKRNSYSKARLEHCIRSEIHTRTHFIASIDEILLFS